MFDRSLCNAGHVSRGTPGKGIELAAIAAKARPFGNGIPAVSANPDGVLIG